MVALTLRHPHIIPIKGITLSTEHLSLVLPWYDNGEVTTYLRKLKGLGGRSRFIRKINELVRSTSIYCAYRSLTFAQLSQVADGMAYLRQEMVVHGDLSSVSSLRAGPPFYPDFHSSVTSWSTTTATQSLPTSVSLPTPMLPVGRTNQRVPEILAGSPLN